MEIDFVKETCINERCHTIFLIPATVRDELKRTHETFYCPFGHNMYYPAKTAEEKLREQLVLEQKGKIDAQTRLSQKILEVQTLEGKVKVASTAFDSCKKEKEKLRKRLKDVKKGIKGKSEKELDDYVKKRLKDLEPIRLKTKEPKRDSAGKFAKKE
jgi:hypothetical protein